MPRRNVQLQHVEERNLFSSRRRRTLAIAASEGAWTNQLRSFRTAVVVAIATLACHRYALSEGATRRHQESSSRLVRCSECECEIRRRVLVAPIDVTDAAGYGAIPVTSVSSEIQTSLARAFGDTSTVLLVDTPPSRLLAGDRSERGSSGQAILRMALSPAKIERNAVRESSAETERALKEASDLESRGINLVAEADRRQGSIESEAGAAAQAAANSGFKGDMIACAAIALNSFNCKGDWTCTASVNAQVQDCQERARQRQRERASMAAEGVRAHGDQDSSSRRAEGQRLFDQALVLRRDALQKAAETYELHIVADVAVKWSLSDVHGLVLASGEGHGESARNDSGIAKELALAETGPPIEAVVRQASQSCALSVASRVSEAMRSIPFRAKVVRVIADGVVINAGADLGISVGDTFGLLSRQSPLTDPDTGRSLESPPQPVGKLRVTQVQPLYSTAVRMESAGQPKRGDEVQWVGVWGPKDMKLLRAPRGSHLVNIEHPPAPTPIPAPDSVVPRNPLLTKEGGVQ